MLHVDDMVELNPFEGASNRTAVMVLQKGQVTRYPVPYTLWRKKAGARFTYTSTLDEVKANTERRKWYAEPAQPNDSTSQWLTAPKDALAGIRKVMGKTDYEAHLGVNTGGANAVYWLEKQLERPDGLWLMRNLTEGAKRQVQEVTVPLEPALLYPLLRGRDVQRWQASPSAWILIPQDLQQPNRAYPEDALQVDYPKTYAYLKQFEKELRQRSGYKQILSKREREFYGVMDINTYSFAPWKVVWREVASLPDVAVIGMVDEKPVIPAHTVVLVDCEEKLEAHFVCALINSSPARLTVQSYIVLHPDPHILDHIRIPRYNPEDETHRQLAEWSERAHEAAKAGNEKRLREIEAKINRLAVQLWGLTEDELKAVRRALQTLASKQEATDGGADD